MSQSRGPCASDGFACGFLSLPSSQVTCIILSIILGQRFTFVYYIYCILISVKFKKNLIRKVRKNKTPFVRRGHDTVRGVFTCRKKCDYATYVLEMSIPYPGCALDAGISYI